MRACSSGAVLVPLLGSEAGEEFLSGTRSLSEVALSELFFKSFCFYLYLFLKFLFIYLLFRATPAAYGGSQARGPIGVAAAGLHYSHSHAGSELHLGATPQLTATPDP